MNILPEIAHDFNSSSIPIPRTLMVTSTVRDSHRSDDYVGKRNIPSRSMNKTSSASSTNVLIGNEGSPPLRRGSRRRRVSSHSDTSAGTDLSDGGSHPGSTVSSLPVSPRQNHVASVVPRRRSNAADGSGDGPRYRCSECGSPFSRLEHLKRHLVKHTGERNFACNICGKTFSRSDNCKQHMRKHVGPDGDTLARLQPVVLSSGNKASDLLASKAAGKNSAPIHSKISAEAKVSKSGDVSLRGGNSNKAQTKVLPDLIEGQSSVNLRSSRRSRVEHANNIVVKENRRVYSNSRSRKGEDDEDDSESDDDENIKDSEELRERDDDNEEDSVDGESSGNEDESDDKPSSNHDLSEIREGELEDAQEESDHEDPSDDTQRLSISSAVPMVPVLPMPKLFRAAPEVPDLDSFMRRSGGSDFSWPKISPTSPSRSSCRIPPVLRFDWASAGPSCVTCGLVFGNVDSLVAHLTNDHLPDLSETISLGTLSQREQSLLSKNKLKILVNGNDLMNACPLSPLPEADTFSESSDVDLSSSFSSSCCAMHCDNSSTSLSSVTHEIETDDPLGIRLLADQCEIGVETVAERLVMEIIGRETTERDSYPLLLN